MIAFRDEDRVESSLRSALPISDEIIAIDQLPDAPGLLCALRLFNHIRSRKLGLNLLRQVEEKANVSYS